VIELRNITVRVGAFVLLDLSLSVPAGRYGVLMGPSGSGKTTLLETICGLRTPTSGRVLLGGQDVTDWPPAQRGLGYVPQDAALFPTLNVRQHLEFALRLRKWEEARIARRVTELASRLGLSSLLGRLPPGLSGGERQRVALGRALAFDPAVLLLDEPVSSLDEPARDEMIALLQELHRERGPTVLHVTHSRGEAERLGEQVIMIRGAETN